MRGERKMKVKRIVMLFFGAFTFLVLSFGIKKIAFSSCPLSNHTTLEELNQMNLQVEYVEDSASWTSEVYDSFTDNEVAGAKECSCILVGKPTGNIYFNRGTVLQEVYVTKVIKGSCKYKKIWIQNGLKSTLTYDKGTVLIKGMDRSFMQEECEYLLFCNPIATNQYSDKKVYTEAEGMWFGCYNLTRDSNIIVEGNDNTYNPQVEFYTTKEKTIECYNQAKRKLIEMYYDAS